MINTFKRELKKWKFCFLRAELVRFLFSRKDESGRRFERDFIFADGPASLSQSLTRRTKGRSCRTQCFAYFITLFKWIPLTWLFCFWKWKPQGAKQWIPRKWPQKVFVFVPRDFLGRIIGRFSFYSSFNLCLVFPFLFIVTEGSAASTIKRRLVKADFDTLLNFNQV